MSNILLITDEAATQIKNILVDAPKGVDSLLVAVDKSGCNGYSYKLDFANSSEFKNYETIKKDSFKILIDPKAIMFLLGSTMDYKTDKLSSRFTFKNPNETGTCGCGESFSI